jgi:hypothetical protein
MESLVKAPRNEYTPQQETALMTEAMAPHEDIEALSGTSAYSVLKWLLKFRQISVPTPQRIQLNHPFLPIKR